MTLIEFIFFLVGACVIVFFGWKLIHTLMMLYPKLCYPLPKNFFSSMGKWAVITGGSDGIGKAYATELAQRGLDVVIISRNKTKLDMAAKDIERTTGGKVMVVAADFTGDDIYECIKENVEGLDIGILVNNVGILPSLLPCKLLETADLEVKMHEIINCNVKSMVKMCQIILPGMVERGKGIILNVSSGIAKIPCPLYTIYAASKVFVERFSQGLQAEYKSNGILIQSVSPFGVSTQMTGHQKPNMITFTAEEFVQSSLMYLKAGEKTYGSICHSILVFYKNRFDRHYDPVMIGLKIVGWIVQTIPNCILSSKTFQQNFQNYVLKKMMKWHSENQALRKLRTENIKLT